MSGAMPVRAARRRSWISCRRFMSAATWKNAKPRGEGSPSRGSRVGPPGFAPLIPGHVISAPRRSVALPIDVRRVGPELLERVILAGLRVEHMHHDVAVVLHDPPAR